MIMSQYVVTLAQIAAFALPFVAPRLFFRDDVSGGGACVSKKDQDQEFVFVKHTEDVLRELHRCSEGVSVVPLFLHDDIHENLQNMFDLTEYNQRHIRASIPFDNRVRTDMIMLSNIKRMCNEGTYTYSTKHGFTWLEFDVCTSDFVYMLEVIAGVRDSEILLVHNNTDRFERTVNFVLRSISHASSNISFLNMRYMKEYAENVIQRSIVVPEPSTVADTFAHVLRSTPPDRTHCAMIAPVISNIIEAW